MSRGTPGDEARRRAIEQATLHVGRRAFESRYGRFDVHFFRELGSETTAMAITRGALDGSAPLLARVHSACVTSECLMGRDCDCAEQLDGALAAVGRAGRGLVLYLMQEGRGAGLTAKARDRMIVQASGNRMTTFEAYASMGLPADLRRYDVVAPVCRLLGVRAPLHLLTNNPDKLAAVAEALADEKLEVCGAESIQGPSSPFNRDYLRAKRDSGHALDGEERRLGARPPRPVRVFEPVSSAQDPDRVVTASYFLPIARLASADRAGTEARSAPPQGAQEADWFRASVVYDRETERESIVLSWPEPPATGPSAVTTATAVGAPSRVTMRLLDRLPGAPSAGRAALQRALAGIRARRGGAVVVDFDDRDDAAS